ncbi:MAG: exonuclease domain-containing protein [Chitinophagales bacterium]
MFSVIDIETTGSHSQYHGITEVAIVNFDGEKITDQFSSLIKAETEIPNFISHLTGITNEMIADAPEWNDVMNLIDDFTRDRILIAHNAHFDYSFLKNAFLQSGKNFQRKTLCTLRLSKQIFPGLPSYSLDKICRQLNISVKPEHRALSDAMAALQLFQLLKENDHEGKIDLSLKQRASEFRLPPNLPQENIKSLPQSAGVYYFLAEGENVLYVGKAKNIRARILQHFTSNSSTRSRTRLMNSIHKIQFEVCGNELIALLRESAEIKKYFPPFNAAQKIADTNFGLYLYEDGKGYQRFTLKKLKKFDQPLLAFSSLQEARNFLIEKMREFRLCAKLSGLQRSRNGCFDHEAGLCDGACIGEISTRVYNARVKKSLKAMKSDSITCAIIGEGRNRDENSVVILENGKYLGFGYAEKSSGKKSFRYWKKFISPQKDNREVQMIIRSYLQTHNDYRIVFGKS